MLKILVQPGNLQIRCFLNELIFFVIASSIPLNRD